VAVKRDSFSVAFTVGAYGSAFGAAAVANHFSILQACLLSLLLFSGASQFAVIGVLGAGGSAVSAIATASLLGVRNGLYALRLAPHLCTRILFAYLRNRSARVQRHGVALSQSDSEDMRKGFWYTGVGVFIFWNFFTVLGAVGAKAIGNPSAWGLDAAVPAAFLGLLWPRLASKQTWAIAAAAIVLSLSLVPFVSAGIPIISCALLALIVGWQEKRAVKK